MLEELPVVAGVVDWAAALLAAPGAAVPTRTAKTVRFMVLFLTDAASTGFASGRLASIVGLETHHPGWKGIARSEEHTSELQSLMRISYAVFCLKKKTKKSKDHTNQIQTLIKVT